MSGAEKPVEGTATEVSDEEAVAAAAAAAGLTPHEAIPSDITDADDYKPAAGELVAISGDDAYRVMDRADEIQILDELQTRPLGEMVYSFPGEGGEKVTGLSYAGVRETVRTLNRDRFTAIRVDHTRPPQIDVVVEDGVRYYRVMVYAADLATGSGQWGIAHEPQRMKLKDSTQNKWRQRGRGDEIDSDGKVWDKFALTKALGKAQRNAMHALLPVEFVESLKALYLRDMKKVREIAAGPGAEALAELPPPDDSPEMKELQEQARTLYAELRGIDAAALLPARFNVLMTHAQHDQDWMRDFIAHIESEIAVRREVDDAQSGQ